MTLCPITGCDHPAGTRCTMSGCPGFKIASAVSRDPLPRGKAGAVIPYGVRHPFLNVVHDAQHNAVTL